MPMTHNFLKRQIRNEEKREAEVAHQRTMQALAKIAKQPVEMKGEPLPDPAKVAQRKITERSLQTRKFCEFQPSLITDAEPQLKLF